MQERSSGDSYEAVQGALRGEGAPLDAATAKMLWYLLEHEAGCDAEITPRSFTVWYVGRGASPYVLAVAPGVVGFLLEGEALPGPGHVIRPLGPGTIPAVAPLPPQPFGTRYVRIDASTDRTVIRIRPDAAALADLGPEVPIEGPHRFVVGERACPHCGRVPDRYRVLGDDSLVCMACGASMPRASRRSQMTGAQIALAAGGGILAVVIALGIAGVIAPLSAAGGSAAAVAVIVIALRGRWFRAASAHQAAATALLLQAVMIVCGDVGSTLDSPEAAIAFLVIDLVLGLVVVAALVAVALEAPRWAVAGAVGWAAGWALQAAATLWVVRWLAGAGAQGAVPDVGLLPSGLVLASGVVIGAAVAAGLPGARRRIVLGLVVGYALLAGIAVMAEQRLRASGDVREEIEAHRRQLDAASCAMLVALATVMWLGGRWRASVPFPSARVARRAR